MRIGFFGAGAVGAYFGARLIAASEHDVTLIARGAHLDAMRATGLRIESLSGDLNLAPSRFHATDNPAAVGPLDAVFVTVKAWAVTEAAQAVRPMIGPDTTVVPLQNGVEAAGQLADALGSVRVIGGTCRIFTEVAAPGLIRHSAGQPTVTIGEMDGNRTDRVDRLHTALSIDGITAHVATDIRAAIWEKLMFVGPLAGVGAVARAPLGVIRSVPESRRLLEDCMEEIGAVATAHGVTVRPGVVDDTSPGDATASMHRDIVEGRPSELEAQTGVIVRMGRDAGVPTPAHSAIYAALLPSELRARGRL